jgi:hypothetical protein
MITMNKTKLRQAPYPSLIADLPGFVDISWGNDCTDSLLFELGGRLCFMFCEEVDRSEREQADASRYFVAPHDDDETDFDNPFLTTEDPDALVAWILKVQSDKDICEECEHRETLCACPCVNCGSAMSAHFSGLALTPGTDCPQR